MASILLTGGTGFIGRHLIPELLDREHSVAVLSRDRTKAEKILPASVTIDTALSSLWEAKPDVVINLSGEPLAEKRWNDARKQRFVESRVGLTNSMYELANTSGHFPTTLISGSAIGYYGNKGDKWLTEDLDTGSDFAASLCQQWEAAAQQFEQHDTRVCYLRTGLVLGLGGGLLKPMLTPFKMGAGGPIGDGTQWQSWIHVADLVGIIIYLLEHETLSGRFNGVASSPVTNREFVRALGKTLHRPAILPMPAFALELLFGELSELMLGSQRVSNKKIEEAGYAFRFDNVDDALQDILH